MDSAYFYDMDTCKEEKGTLLMRDWNTFIVVKPIRLPQLMTSQVTLKNYFREGIIGTSPGSGSMMRLPA